MWKLLAVISLTSMAGMAFIGAILAVASPASRPANNCSERGNNPDSLCSADRVPALDKEGTPEPDGKGAKHRGWDLDCLLSDSTGTPDPTILRGSDNDSNFIHGNRTSFGNYFYTT